ncbi:hypothetical protein RJI07_00340 [Mycoplasmatota bacterium WC30]
MDNQSKFEELKKLKKNENTIADLNVLLSLVKKEKDSVLTMQILMYLTECYKYLRQHDMAISFLETEVNDEFFNQKDDRLKVIDELVRILLRTEDFIKLKAVLFTRERYLTNEHQKVMQKFYYAVCHEGLKENKLAIDYLISIKDNISNSNLVSKYLKLSMLFLKESHIEKAKEYYRLAVKFDHKTSNPIFHLAESDILYFEGDYLEALAKYQEYFIKSKNKRRYLDRYILINIKLNRLDEAWRFYQEFLPVMKTLVSRNYRIVFYTAAKTLAKELNNTTELDKLDYLIQELEPSKPMLNQFDNVYRLLSLSFKSKRYLKERDIIFDIFTGIQSLYKFQKLLFIRKTEESISFLHLSKNLLLEKNPKSTEYSQTLIQEIVNTKPINDLYMYDDLLKYSKGIYKTVDTAYVFVNGIKRENSFDYFVVYSAENENFDFQQKLVLLANEILKKHLFDFDLNIKQFRLFNNYKNLFNQENIGLVKIEKNIMHFLNEHAKNILGIDDEYLAFEDFQSYLEEKVFIDEFLYTDKLILNVKHKEEVRKIEFSIIRDELIIFAIVKEYHEDSENTVINQFLGIPNEIQLLEDNTQCESKTIVLFNITNYLHFFKDYNYARYQELLKLIIARIKELSKHHFENVYLESFNLIYLTLKSTDKRVVNRIVDGIYKDKTDFDIRTSIIQINQCFSYDKLIQLRYLNSLTNSDSKYIHDNKNFRYNLELAKTILININKLITKKDVPLNYQAIGNWRTNDVEFLNVEISEKAMLGETNSLTRVLKAANLEAEWDTLVSNSLVKDIKESNQKAKFFVNLSYKTYSDIKLLKKIIKKIENIGYSLNNYVFGMNLQNEINVEDIIPAINLLQEKQIQLFGYSFISKINLNNYDIFKYFNYLILDIKELEIKNLDKFLEILSAFNIVYVLNHHQATLKKSDLERFNITYVTGIKFPKYESVTTTNP